MRDNITTNRFTTQPKRFINQIVNLNVPPGKTNKSGNHNTPLTKGKLHLIKVALLKIKHLAPS